MTDNNVHNDIFAKKVIRATLIIESAFFLFVVLLLFFRTTLAALCFAILSFFVLIGVFFWLYKRFISFPIVVEKKKLERDLITVQSQIKSETSKVKQSKQRRNDLFEDEKKNTSLALEKLQKSYIQSGLASTEIESAKIPSIGPKLKEKLIAHRILTAADINSKITLIEGFGESKTQILLDWQRIIYEGFHSTRPTTLSNEELDRLKKEYLNLHQENDVFHNNAEKSKQAFEQKLKVTRERLNELSSLSFVAYFQELFSTNKVWAFSSLAVLILMQCLVGIGTGTANVIASLPTLTLTPTNTATATQTLTSTITYTPTITNTPTITFTPTVTLTVTNTFTPQPTLPPNILGCIPQTTTRETGQVVAIVDGDTIDVNIDNNIYRVRYIGIDTPERNEPFYNQATAYNQILVA